MEGREHTGVIWVLAACDRSTREERARWERSYATERIAAVLDSGAAGRAERFRLAEGFELPGGATHVTIYETGNPDVAAAAATVATLCAPGEAVSHYTRTTDFESSGEHPTGGVVAVLTDCNDPADEPAFDVWYDEHVRFVIENMDHHACTRYLGDGSDGSLARHVALYETENADPGKVQRDGWDWYFQSPQAQDHATPSSLVLRGEVALERLD